MVKKFGSFLETVTNNGTNRGIFFLLAAKSSPITSLRPTLFGGFSVGFCGGFCGGFCEGFCEGFWGTIWGTRFLGGDELFLRAASGFLGRGVFDEVVVCLSRSSSVFRRRRPFF